MRPFARAPIPGLRGPRSGGSAPARDHRSRTGRRQPARLRFLTRLIDRARALDPTRLVTAATELTRDGDALSARRVVKRLALSASFGYTSGAC